MKVAPGLLYKALTAFKDSKVEKLNLSNCDLDNVPPDQLYEALTALKFSNVKALSLKKNYLGVPDLLYKALMALKDSKVEKLNLSHSYCDVPPDQLCEVLSALKFSNVKELNLSSNHLGKVRPDLLYKALVALKDSKVEKLNLEYNNLGFHIEPLCSALKGTAVRALSLGNNGLCNVTPNLLCKGFHLLKDTAVEVLNLKDREDYYGTDNDLSGWDPEDVRKVLFALDPTRVRKVYWNSKLHKCYPALVHEFNTKIAYPHDTIDHKHELQRTRPL